tara:strand:- start:713 stop:901 length:189 start_codon:yes stop_codon:yes gene_type:complete
VKSVSRLSVLLYLQKWRKDMLTKVLKRTKNEIKPTKKWDNEVIKMVERYDTRKKIKEVSQRH